MIFYHPERDLWLNTNNILAVISDENEITRMKIWLSRDDRNPIPRFEREGWLHVVESAPQWSGEPLLGEKTRSLDPDRTTFSWMVGGTRWDSAIDADAAAAREAAREAAIAAEEASNAEAAILAAAKAIEDLRSAKLDELNQWYDSHKGIEVVEGITLPIQRDGRIANFATLSVQLAMSADPVLLIDKEDFSVAIPAASIGAAMTKFSTVYHGISVHLDTLRREIAEATTLTELNDIVVLPTDPDILGA